MEISNNSCHWNQRFKKQRKRRTFSVSLQNCSSQEYFFVRGHQMLRSRCPAVRAVASHIPRTAFASASYPRCFHRSGLTKTIVGQGREDQKKREELQHEEGDVLGLPPLPSSDAHGIPTDQNLHGDELFPDMEHELLGKGSPERKRGQETPLPKQGGSIDTPHKRGGASLLYFASKPSATDQFGNVQQQQQQLRVNGLLEETACEEEEEDIGLASALHEQAVAGSYRQNHRQKLEDANRQLLENIQALAKQKVLEETLSHVTVF